MLNRSEKMDITTRVDRVTGQIGAEMHVWEMMHPDLKATHTFGNDRTVRPVTRQFSPTITDSGFSYTFPKHSLTILRLELQ